VKTGGVLGVLINVISEKERAAADGELQDVVFEVDCCRGEFFACNTLNKRPVPRPC
jgi:hypothetical protein